MIKAYLKYLLSRKDEYALHSPFVYELYSQIIKPDQKLAQYEAIEDLRKKLHQNQQNISVTDYGAGSKKPQKRIANIAKAALAKAKINRLLSRLLLYFEPKTCMELGTSLGINTCYMAAAQPNMQLFSFEGCPNLAQIAQQNMAALHLQNCQIIVGDLSQTLESQLNKVQKLDFVFFDANHRYQPTVQYFEQCLAKCHEDSVFVFDDIHWSEQMEQAWAYIKQHEQVTLSIDLYQVGLVFFRKKQPKQHFVLKY
jgi:predicted O-methyltransferase YrrM